MAVNRVLSAIAVGVMLALLSSPAVAEGKIDMASADGAKLKIKCDTTNCLVKEKKVGSKWKTIERTIGGRKAFKELKTKYQQVGYN